MCPRKQTTEPKLLILVSFCSGEVTSYTDISYCGKYAVFFWATLYTILSVQVNFVVWSTNNNEALLTVPCGGGHRAWAFSPLDDTSTAFVCIKMKQLLMSKISSTAWQRQTILKVSLTLAVQNLVDPIH